MLFIRRLSILTGVLIFPFLAASWNQADAQGRASDSRILTQATPSAGGAEPFYKGKTIRLLIAYSVGGTNDISGRLVAAHLGNHIPGKPAVVPQNMPGAGGVVAANYLYNVAKQDDLTIALLNRGNYLEQMRGDPSVQFDFTKFRWIGSVKSSFVQLACRTDSGFTSVEKIRASGKIPRIGDSGKGSIGSVFTNLVAAALDLKFKFVHGFPGGREIDLAIERGEADCRATATTATLRPPWSRWLKEGFITFVLQQGPAKDKLLPKNVPVLAELAPPGAKPVLDLMDTMLAFSEFNFPFAAPPGMPEERVKILREGFEKMARDERFSKEGKKLIDWDGFYLKGSQLQAVIEKAVNKPPDIVREVKKVLES